MRPGEVLRPALGDEQPAVDDRDAVADLLDLAEQVGVEEHGDAAAAQLDEQPADGPAPGRVEGARGLVEQQQRRLPDERLRDPEPLLHALRHRLDAAVARLGQADELEQLGALGRAALGAGEPLVQREQLVGARPAGEAEQLREVAERAAGRGRPGGRAADLGGAAGRPDEAARDLHERALAGAVRAEQPDELALADGEVDAAQRVGRAVALREAGHGEGSRHEPRV